MIRTLMLLSISALFFGLASAADPPGGERAKDGMAAIEKKLVGQWRGGPCVGTIVFRADGTFDRTHYTPGSNSITGTWKIQWDALPPLLVMTTKTSDAPDRLKIGDSSEARLTELSEQEFSLAMPHPNAPHYRARFERIEK